MIQTHTLLNVADNTGAKKVLCIGILGGSKKKYARVGDIITVSIKEIFPHSSVKRGELARAVVVRTTKEYRRDDGTYVKFDDNSAILIDKEGNPRGTRVLGPVARELRDKGFTKIISLAPEVI